MDTSIVRKSVKTEEVFKRAQRVVFSNSQFVLDGKLYIFRIKSFIGILLWNLDLPLNIMVILSPYIVSKKFPMIGNMVYAVLYFFLMVGIIVVIHKIFNTVVRRKLFFNTDYIEVKVVEQKED